MNDATSRLGIEFVANGGQATPEFQRQIANSRELAASMEQASATAGRTAQAIGESAKAATATQKQATFEYTEAEKAASTARLEVQRREAAEYTRIRQEMNARFARDAHTQASGMGLTPGNTAAQAAAQQEALAKQTAYVRQEVALMQHEVDQRRMTTAEQLASLEQLLAGVENNLTARITLERAATRARTEMVAATIRSAEAESAAEKAANAEILAATRARIEIYQHQVAMRQMTLQEERAALTELTATVETNYRAQMVIEREMMAVDERLAAERMANSRRVVGALGADTTQLAKVFGRQAGFLRDALYVGGTTAAIIALTEGLGKATAVAAKMEEIETRLNRALVNQKANVADATKAIEEFAQAQSATTRFSQPELLQSVLMLVNAGTSWADAIKIVRVAEDMAAASGKNLETSVHSLMMAEHGLARGLTQYGISVKDAHGKNIDLHTALQLVEKQMGGQSTAAAHGYRQTMAELSHAFEDLSITIGKPVLPILVDLAKELTKDVRAWSDNKDNVRDFSAALHGFVDTVKGVIKAMHDLYEPLREDDKIIEDALDGWNRLFAAIGEGFVRSAQAMAQFQRGIGNELGAAWLDTVAAAIHKLDHAGEVALVAARERAAQQPHASDVEKHLGTKPYDWTLRQEALRQGVNPDFAVALQRHEDYQQNPTIRSSVGAVGLMQVMPATGAGMGFSVHDLEDPGKNIIAGVRYLKSMLDRFGGSELRAAAAYNAGPGGRGVASGDLSRMPAETQAYVRGIMGDLGVKIPGSNGVDTNTAANPTLGRAGGADAEQRKKWELEYQTIVEQGKRERLTGIATWRDTEISALRTLAAEQGVTAKERLKAMSAIDSLQLASIKAGETAQAKAARLAIASVEEHAKKTAESVDLEIAQLRRVEAQYHLTGTARIALESKIDTLQQTSWKNLVSSIMTSANAHKSDAESTAILLDKLQQMQRLAGVGWHAPMWPAPLTGGARTAAQAAVPKLQGMVDKSQEGDVQLEVADLEKTAERLYQSGEINRARYEAMLRSMILDIAQIKNHGDAIIKDYVDQHLASDTAKLAGLYVADVGEYVKKLDQAAKITGAAIDASGASLPERQSEHIAVIRAQIEALEKQAAVYEALKGVGSDAYKKIQEQLDALRTSEAVATEKITQDWNAWTNSASGHLEKLLEGGKGAFRGLSDAFKQAIHDMEAALLKSVIARLIFGSSAGFNVQDIFSAALFGSAMPQRPGGSSGSAFSLGGGATASSNAGVVSGPYGPIPTGTQSDPVTVKLDANQLPALVGNGATSARAFGGGGGGGGIVVDNGDGTGTITFGGGGGGGVSPSSSIAPATLMALAPLLAAHMPAGSARSMLSTLPQLARTALNLGGSAGGGAAASLLGFDPSGIPIFGGGAPIDVPVGNYGAGGYNTPSANPANIDPATLAALGIPGGDSSAPGGDGGAAAPEAAGSSAGPLARLAAKVFGGGSGPIGGLLTALGLGIAGGNALSGGQHPANAMLGGLLGGGAMLAGLWGGASAGGLGVMGTLGALGPVGWGLIGATALLGAFGGGLIGPHWGPASNSPDRSGTPQEQFNYGQFTSNINGTWGSFNGQNIGPQPAYDVANGGSPMYKQMEQWANAQTKNLGALSPSLRRLYDQIIALEGGNPNADFGIISEHNGVDQLANGLTIAVSAYQTLAGSWASAVGADGTKLPIPVFNYLRTMPDWNAGTMTANGMYNPTTGVYTPPAPTTTGGGSTTGGGTTGGGGSGGGGRRTPDAPQDASVAGGNAAVHVTVYAPNSNFVGTGGVDGLTDTIMKRARDHVKGVGGGNRSPALTV